MAIGLAGGLGLPTALNMMKTHAATMERLEDQTGLQGLGVIPMASPRILEQISRAPSIGAKVPNRLLEAFRLIRANISLRAGRDGKSQCIMITSARPQEGKTTVAANLAWAFQSLGERTLLVDCDLRRGRQHNLVGVDNTFGMTRLLIDEVSLEDAIQSTDNPLLDVIPRGPVIIGTTELLMQKKFASKMSELRQKYDRIVLDAPPVLGLSETASLQALADGVVVVAKAETTSCKDVSDAVSTLRTAGAYLFGFVLNAVDLSKLTNYYYYSYYSGDYHDVAPDDVEEKPLPVRR